MLPKNAICMLAFGNESYIVGASLSAYAHKRFIRNLNLDIDLVLMIDKTMESYRNDLLLFFDKVIVIDLIMIKLHPNYKIINKYSEWMAYSINKWQVLKLIEYDKVLFMDVDILPFKSSFYDIFNINTPAILLRDVSLEYNKIVDPDLILKKSNQENPNYSDASGLLKHSLDGGTILFKPSLELYDEYISFLKRCEGSDGYTSSKVSGADETTMTLFLFMFKRITIYGIPYEFASVPWDRFKYDKSGVKGINFTSLIKPWLRIPMIQWADENVWHSIAHRALNKSKLITKLYLKLLLAELKKFYRSIDHNLKEKSPPYNMECLTDPSIRDKTLKLLKAINRSTNPLDMIKYLSIARKIQRSMKHHTILNMESLMHTIRDSR